MNYCGFIWTSHGMFLLPQSSMLSLFGPSREEMVQKLRTGCRYRMTYYGYRARVYEGMLRTNRHIPIVLRLSDPFDCDTD